MEGKGGGVRFSLNTLSASNGRTVLAPPQDPPPHAHPSP